MCLIILTSSKMEEFTQKLYAELKSMSNRTDSDVRIALVIDGPTLTLAFSDG